MDSETNDHEMVFEEWIEGGVPVGRVGRSKATGARLVTSRCDSQGREVEKSFFADDGQLRTRIVYEYDYERKPLRLRVFDRTGKLIRQQLRGKGPESFE